MQALSKRRHPHLKHMARFGVPGILLALAFSAHAASRQAPNIIFILADDLGWNATSVAMDPAVPHSKSDYYQTPNLEQLAADGMRFSRAYSAAPICTPSRRSLHYGMTPARQRGERFPSTFNPKEHPSIPQALKEIDANYATALFGKWGSQMGATPKEIGYDESDGATDNWVGGMDLPHPETEFLYKIKDDPKKTFSIARRAVSFIKKSVQQDRPFFLNVSFYAVHHDIECRMESLQKYKGRRGAHHFNEAYAAMVDDMDTAVGQILATVEKLGIDNNTYIIFTSDNGGEPGYGMGNFKTAALKQNDSLNYPLKNGKGSLFEGGLRVPLIVSGPGIGKGSVCRQPFAGWDLFPTFFELAGGTASNLSENIDGRSIKNVLLAQTPFQPSPAVLPVFHSPYIGGRKMSAVISGKYKLVKYWDTGTVHLFDLEKDLGEKQDLSAQQPETTQRLQQKMNTYFQDADVELPRKKR